MNAQIPNSALRLDLIIPCFNEAENLPRLIERAVFAKSECPNLRIIFVDNGSQDETNAILSAFTSAHSDFTLVRIPENQGYGHGIKFGLDHASADFIGWTHADLQCDPYDAIRALEIASEFTGPVFVKGRRYGRPLGDCLFTVGMTVFESLLFRIKLDDINAQPTIFSRDLLEIILRGPDDFALDLFAFLKARQMNSRVMRFPVRFGPRYKGQSSWNTSLRSRFKFIQRTIRFSFSLAKGNVQ